MFAGKKLKEDIDRENMSMSELARRLYISEGAVRHIVAGIKQPSLAVAIEIASIMGCKVDDLIEREVR